MKVFAGSNQCYHSCYSLEILYFKPNNKKVRFISSQNEIWYNMLLFLLLPLLKFWPDLYYTSQQGKTEVDNKVVSICGRMGTYYQKS